MADVTIYNANTGAVQSTPGATIVPNIVTNDPDEVIVRTNIAPSADAALTPNAVNTDPDLVVGGVSTT